MERDSAQYDEVVGHAARAEPARGAAAVRGCTQGGGCEPSREVPCAVSGSRYRGAHGIAYGVCRLRPSLPSMIRSAPRHTPPVLWQMCRVAWYESPAAIALLHDLVGSRHTLPRATIEAVSVTVGATPHSRVGLPKGPASGRRCDRYGLSNRPHNA